MDTVEGSRCGGKRVGKICGRLRSDNVVLSRLDREARMKEPCLEEQRTKGNEEEPKTWGGVRGGRASTDARYGFSTSGRRFINIFCLK